MQVWLIEPHDPIIARDGRPFGPNPGARAYSLPFPLPSTLAGAIRSRAGRDTQGVFDRDRIPALLEHKVLGPLLAEYDGANPPRYMAPAPADALLLPVDGDAAHADRRRLAPLTLRSGAQCGWPEKTDLAPVGPVRPSPEKPLAAPPRFWHWAALESWLLEPADGISTLHELGHGGATPEARMHVRIDATTQSAEEGMLFQTRGLEFTRTQSRAGAAGGIEHVKLQDAARLVLACATDATVPSGAGALAGERRLVHWQAAAEPLPQCPRDLRGRIAAEGCCRLLLLTPGYFAGGFLPQWLLHAVPGVTAQVLGAVLGRFQGASGWDLQAGQAKPARKLAPAGAVYFLKLAGAPAAIEQFVDTVWLENVSDDAQSRLDGFGLAVLGIWDGKLNDMEVN